MKPIFKTSSTDKNKYHDVDTLVLDVSYLAHRHAHALGKRFFTSEGEMNGHVYGAFKNVKSLLGHVRPRQLAFCYDRGYTWRSELVPSYKATRRGALESNDSWHPTPDVERLFRCFPGLHLASEDLEADDMAAWLALNHESEGAVAIYSADRDLWQLVSDNSEITCVYPKKPGPRQKSQNFWVREATVREDFGVTPNGLAKLKALMGDTSDNIKGVVGGKRPGKKDALRKLADDPEFESYFDLNEAIPKANAPDFLIPVLEEERERIVSNYRITNLRNAVDRVSESPVVKAEGNLGEALGVLVEFECESLLAQVEPLFEMLNKTLSR